MSATVSSTSALHRRSLSLPVPKLERLDDNSCEVTWEAMSPMKGDPINYTLQCMMGNSEFKQVLMLSCDGLVPPLCGFYLFMLIFSLFKKTMIMLFLTCG